MPAHKVAVVIPARHGSTRLPAKPLQLIAGKPLIQRVWERASKARQISEVIIATDSEKIAQVAFDFGAQVALTSPKHRSGTDRVAEVARKLKGTSHVINVQGDEPMIDPRLIDRLADQLLTDRGVEMITAASRFGPDDDVSNPNMVKVVLDREMNALYFSRAAIPFVRDPGEKPPFYRHQGIYGYSIKFLLRFVEWRPGVLEKAESLEQLRALENGARIRVVVTRQAAPGVDTIEDVATVEALLASKRPSRSRT